MWWDGGIEFIKYIALIRLPIEQSFCSKIGDVIKEADLTMQVPDSKLRLQVSQFSFSKFELHKGGYHYHFIKEYN